MLEVCGCRGRYGKIGRGNRILLLQGGGGALIGVQRGGGCNVVPLQHACLIFYLGNSRNTVTDSAITINKLCDRLELHWVGAAETTALKVKGVYFDTFVLLCRQ